MISNGERLLGSWASSYSLWLWKKHGVFMQERHDVPFETALCNKPVKIKELIEVVVVNQLPLAARTSVFRPVIEQIGQFELDNASYVELRRNFTGDASLVVFAGRNPTVISKPRFFLYADGRVPELTLDIHFEEGKLIHLIWKEDDCAACYAKNQLCRDGSCVTRETDCQSADTTNSTITDYNCRLMIIITFSGVDRYSQLLTTWYQITHINRYSMASIFNALERQIQEGLERLDRSG
ncbi:hypothetical protein GOP47_0025691 [Adiantum capillus-veneris]|uniref:Uncharacterized protein n=1 Tax=Adiantum capillus-veneris TaxID=13818 RepID=A0A9D4U144_ADICA|nr:hypothetical protein GOP47_0025691 [Adiantum capillus-veneris]